MLTRALENVQLPDKRKAGDVWERIYVVTAFYVGLADDLGRQQYKAALAKVCGAALDLATLGDAGKMQALRQELAKYNPPAIYSGTGGQIAGSGSDDLLKVLDKTTGFRLMGQRFIPDSYMMGKLVFPTVVPATPGGILPAWTLTAGPIRGFPRGLDVMAILGSKRARVLLTELGDDAYMAARVIRRRLEAANRRIRQTIRPGLEPQHVLVVAARPEAAAGGVRCRLPGVHADKGIPHEVAQHRTGVVAQLRHDTILYAKQSYTAKAISALVSLNRCKATSSRCRSSTLGCWRWHA